MTSTDKKEWSTPRLRVFVRTRTEERILAGCKTTAITGASAIVALCTNKTKTGKCAAGNCSTLGTS